MGEKDNLYTAVVAGDRDMVRRHVEQAIQQKADLPALISRSMIPAMKELGDLYGRHAIEVPDMLLGARAVQAGLDLVEPALIAKGERPRRKICIGCAEGDLHGIGKNIVAMILRASGYEVEDLGVDCSLDDYRAAIGRSARAALCSVLMNRSLPFLEHMRTGLAGLGVPIVAGGGALSSSDARRMGIHYARNAFEAVRLLDGLLTPKAA